MYDAATSYTIKYSQGLRYYPFAVNLDRYIRSCSTLNDLSNRVCDRNKTEDLHKHLFNSFMSERALRSTLI